jgi:hypothetical protein
VRGTSEHVKGICGDLVKGVGGGARYVTDTLPISTLKIPVPPPEDLSRKISQRDDLLILSTDRSKAMMYGNPIRHGEKLYAE